VIAKESTVTATVDSIQNLINLPAV
jgi:hypothetical protein